MSGKQRYNIAMDRIAELDAEVGRLKHELSAAAWNADVAAICEQLEHDRANAPVAHSRSDAKHLMVQTGVEHVAKQDVPTLSTAVMPGAHASPKATEQTRNATDAERLYTWSEGEFLRHYANVHSVLDASDATIARITRERDEVLSLLSALYYGETKDGAGVRDWNEAISAELDARIRIALGITSKKT